MSLHEDLRRTHDVQRSSNRSFGLTVGGIISAIGSVNIALSWGDDVLWYNIALLLIGLTLFAAGLVMPDLLSALNRAWVSLGLLLFKVVNPIVLAFIYFVVVTPIGLLMRFSGKDPLRRKFDKSVSSYWIAREPPGPDPKTMTEQF